MTRGSAVSVAVGPAVGVRARAGCGVAVGPGIGVRVGMGKGLSRLNKPLTWHKPSKATAIKKRGKSICNADDRSRPQRRRGSSPPPGAHGSSPESSGLFSVRTASGDMSKLSLHCARSAVARFAARCSLRCSHVMRSSRHKVLMTWWASAQPRRAVATPYSII